MLIITVRDVCSQVWCPILEICARITHPSAHTPRAGALGAIGALLKGTSVMGNESLRERCSFAPPTY